MKQLNLVFLVIILIAVLYVAINLPVAGKSTGAPFLICGEGTFQVAIVDEGSDLISGYECKSYLVECGAGTIRKSLSQETDGRGGTVDRDKCESIRPTTICDEDEMLSDNDGRGGTVDRDGNRHPDGSLYPIERACNAVPAVKG